MIRQSFMLIGRIDGTLTDMWPPQTQLNNQIIIDIDILGYKRLNHVNTIVGIVGNSFSLETKISPV